MGSPLVESRANKALLTVAASLPLGIYRAENQPDRSTEALPACGAAGQNVIELA
jgi:hypothetical protein